MRRVTSDMEIFSDDDAAELAASDPQQLLRRLSTERDPIVLSLLARNARSIRDEGAMKVLFKLLDHDNTIVKEGAIYGIADWPEARRRLHDIAERDSNIGLRQAAKNVILFR